MQPLRGREVLTGISVPADFQGPQSSSVHCTQAIYTLTLCTPLGLQCEGTLHKYIFAFTGGVGSTTPFTFKMEVEHIIEVGGEVEFLLLAELSQICFGHSAKRWDVNASAYTCI